MHINVLILTCVCAFVRLDMPQRVHACEIVLVRAPRVCIHVQEYQGQCYLLCASSCTCVCLCVVSVCVGVSEYVPVCAWAWTWDCLGKRTSLHSWGMYMWTQIACANVTCALRAHVFVNMFIVFVDVLSTCLYRNECARMHECDLCFARARVSRHVHSVCRCI